MAETSSIEWTDATWNPITGCTVVSPGCTNCYAMKLAGTRLKNHPSRAGLTVETKAGPVWTGGVRLNEDWLAQPLRWARPRRIFVCAHSDLFHEAVPFEVIDRVFAVMALSPHHTFQVLTKRSARMREYIEGAAGRLARFMIDEYILGAPDRPPAGRTKSVRWPVVSIGDIDLPDDVTMAPWPLPNVWLGVSAEDQVRAVERIPDLLRTPAAVRFLSGEPLLEELDLTGLCDGNSFWDALGGRRYHDAPADELGYSEPCAKLDWVIVGGESATRARPMHPDWVRWIRNACAEAGVAFFFKQWGSWTPGENVERQRGVVETATWCDGRWDYDRESLASTDGTVDDEPDVYRIGKKAAGRLLDGVTHDAMPAAHA